MRKEWRTLVEVIYDIGLKYPDGRAAISFGELFHVSPMTYILTRPWPCLKTEQLSLIKIDKCNFLIKI